MRLCTPGDSTRGPSGECAASQPVLVTPAARPQGDKVIVQVIAALSRMVCTLQPDETDPDPVLPCAPGTDDVVLSKKYEDEYWSKVLPGEEEFSDMPAVHGNQIEEDGKGYGEEGEDDPGEDDPDEDWDADLDEDLDEDNSDTDGDGIRDPQDKRGSGEKVDSNDDSPKRVWPFKRIKRFGRLS